MPLGVPKVPYRIPGNEKATWVDLHNVLYHERTIFLGQEIDHEITKNIMGVMLYLSGRNIEDESIEDANSDLFLFINSPGGWITSGVAIFNTMSMVTPDVCTICIGMAASTASFVLLGGEPTKRIAFPHARIMIRELTSTYFREKPGKFYLESKQFKKAHKMLINFYKQRTGKPFWVIAKDMEREFFMSATEAKDYGIVDIVGADVGDEESSETEPVWFPKMYQNW